MLCRLDGTAYKILHTGVGRHPVASQSTLDLVREDACGCWFYLFARHHLVRTLEKLRYTDHGWFVYAV